MTARFVLDESTWAAAAAADKGALSNAVQHLLERIETVHERNEGVVKHPDYYQTPLGDGVRLYSALFELGCCVELDRDLAERLRLALDRIDDLDDPALMTCDAEFEGSVRFSPGAVWAHACCLEQHHMAVLPLPLGAVPRGRVEVTVADVTCRIFFVVEESEHVGFFRSIIALENADEAMFEYLARSAFPALEWADNIWRGLGRFSRPYVEVRAELVRSLGGLSDHGAECFDEYRARDPRQLQQILSAHVGAETSDENGLTKKHRPSKQDRTRSHRGTDKVFWWHAKLRPNVDRIHFLYEPPTATSPVPENGRIVVGLFKDHCILPN